jgi:hypothetical protein
MNRRQRLYAMRARHLTFATIVSAAALFLFGAGLVVLFGYLVGLHLGGAL